MVFSRKSFTRRPIHIFELSLDNLDASSDLLYTTGTTIPTYTRGMFPTVYMLKGWTGQGTNIARPFSSAPTVSCGRESLMYKAALPRSLYPIRTDGLESRLRLHAFFQLIHPDEVPDHVRNMVPSIG